MAEDGTTTPSTGGDIFSSGVAENVQSSENAQSSDDTYDTQLLGFTPKSFCNGIYNAMNQYLVDGLEAMKNYLISRHGDVMSNDDLNDGVLNIQQKVMEEFDTTFDKFEVYAFNNVMNVPSHAVLPEDEIQLKPVAPENENIELQIKELKESILAIKLANANAQQELELAVTTQEELDKIVNKMEECDPILSSSTEIKDAIDVSMKEMLKLVPHYS
ncbi:hypothetical protein SNE40_001109 [Patella caerulea]|uniref:Protein MIS12 homolog n=1 Tax=Patella caerulea TaxID=87958 RepID=A0AAN8Q7T3_PATCE